MVTKLVRAALIALATLGAASLAKAAVLDQENLLNADGSGMLFYVSDPGMSWQQSLTAGIEGRLERVEFLTDRADGSIVFFVDKGTPWQSDPHAFSSTVDVAASVVGQFYGNAGPWWVSVDVSAAGIDLDAGDAFVLGFKGTGTQLGLYGTSGNLYPGSLFFEQVLSDGQIIGPIEYEEYDFSMRTFMNPVPEPHTIAMLLAGLGVIGLATRRR